MFMACIFQLEHMFYKGRDLYLFFTILYPQRLECGQQMLNTYLLSAQLKIRMFHKDLDFQHFF